MKKHQWFGLIIIALVAGTSFYFLGSNPSPSVPNQNVKPETQQNVKADGGNLNSALPSAGAPKGQAPTPSAYNQKANEQEIKDLRKLTDENTKKIYAKMKQDEIKSLKESIINDEKLLKQIESRGTGIDDYKYIETNLAKRRKRLNELTKK